MSPIMYIRRSSSLPSFGPTDWSTYTNTVQDATGALKNDLSTSSFIAQSYFMISGDFDIQIDQQQSQYPSTYSCAVYLEARSATNVGGFIYKDVDQNGPHFRILSYPESTGPLANGSGNIRGMLRLVRSGSTFTGYYSDSYDVISPAQSLVGNVTKTNENVRIRLVYGPQSLNPALTCQVRNFRINSGTIV